MKFRSPSHSGLSLSACIITLNEEQNLPRCLDSISGIVDEVVVVDSLSTDRTRQIASAAGARVFPHPFRGYVGQKQLALEKATGDWALCLDADEWLSEALRDNIAQLMERGPGTGIAGYRLKRKTFYLGRWLRHHDSSDWKLRLVRRDPARWTGSGPHDLHERLEVEGRVGRLKGELCHHPHKTLSEHVLRVQEFTDILARNPPGPMRTLFGMTVEPGMAFLKRYLLQGGFLDGVPGLTFAFMDAAYFFLRHAKAWEARHGRSRWAGKQS